MTDITYYDNTTGQILGNFKNIDLTSYPGEIPQYYIEGLYSASDYYISGGVPIARTPLTQPANRFLQTGVVDNFVVSSLPNPTKVSITTKQTVKQAIDVNFEDYSVSVTDGSFTVTSSIAGNYNILFAPDDITYKRLSFDFAVTPEHGVMTTEYNWNLNNPTLRAAVKYDNINLPYVMNLNDVIVNASRQVTVSSQISYTMTLNVPIVNASRDVVIDTMDSSMTLNVPIVNAAHRILPDITTFEMTLNVPSIMVYEPINLTISLDEALTSTFTLLDPTLNARVDEPITVMSSTMTLNVPTITVI